MLPQLPRSRLQVWFVRVCSCVLVWSCLAQLVAVGDLWRGRSSLLLATSSSSSSSSYSWGWNATARFFLSLQKDAAVSSFSPRAHSLPYPTSRLYKSNGYLKVSCNGGLNQMRSAICDMVTVARFLNLTLVVPELDKRSFGRTTDARLANNGLPLAVQKLRCRVNYQALKFTPQIEALGNRLIKLLKEKGAYAALHLRYEMDMLAFSGCTHGCSMEEAEELKRLRYAYPWWREKEIDSEAKRLQGLCPLTPEETLLVLQAFGFKNTTQMYIASGEIYGSNHRLVSLRSAFPRLVRKEMLLDPEELRQFQNHSSQMAALDYMVSVSSDTFIPTYDGNMAKVVEGHRRYLGFRKSIILNRRKLVELLDLHARKMLSWAEFASTVQELHKERVGQPVCRKVMVGKPKEEDYFYANPYECLINSTECIGASSSWDAIR
ncbi:hypothetical protein HPP92_016235 [Vanilla planifolia]|uniref:O-fucosyltransferase family protein n=1 Tax=Vanilla planifolia TaxID=51239 RepID=A0A835QL43_VANPL|nr:hypothetical protein HPP92_016235 [Vanilla planifolia]